MYGKYGVRVSAWSSCTLVLNANLTRQFVEERTCVYNVLLRSSRGAAHRQPLSYERVLRRTRTTIPSLEW